MNKYKLFITEFKNITKGKYFIRGVTEILLHSYEIKTVQQNTKEQMASMPSQQKYFHQRFSRFSLYYRGTHFLTALWK